MKSDDSAPQSPRGQSGAGWRRAGLQTVRVGMFATALLMIHWSYRERQAAESAKAEAERIPLAVVQDILPAAEEFNVSGTSARSGGGHSQVPGVPLIDPQGRPVGFALQTSPAGDRIIGFSGPTNLLVVFDQDGRILEARVLSSGDTKEHLAQVVEHPEFLASLKGLTWNQALRQFPQVDAVSGATLTSRAIQASLQARLGQHASERRPDAQPDTSLNPGPLAENSLRFPEPPDLEDARQLFPTAHQIVQDPHDPQRWIVYAEPAEPVSRPGDGKLLGEILRTAPAADNLVGYQGPTETLIGLNSDGVVIGISVRESFDNEPYVTYVREDEYFLSVFNGLVLEELAALDIEQAGIEGVSGATMTSMTVAEGVPLAAKARSQKVLAAQEAKSSPTDSSVRPRDFEHGFHWSWRDVGTGTVVLLGVIIGFTSLRAQRAVRITFQAVLILYLGLINGDLLSQAMLVGWAQNGIPWRTAGGLLLLTGAALTIPVLTRRNIYCTHLCPHGAVQQLLKRRLPWQWKVPRGLSKRLALLPLALLAWCLVVPILGLPFSLVDIEPFDAWVFWLAGWATLTVAIVGLVASLFVPMAYCRFGCPTGAVLNFLRYHARSDRWGARDWAAGGLVLLAVALWVA